MGLRCPTLEEKGGDKEWRVWLQGLKSARRMCGLQYGIAREVRTVRIPRIGGGDNSDIVEVKVRDGVFYSMWLSREAEEARKRAILGVDMGVCWRQICDRSAAFKASKDTFRLRL